VTEVAATIAATLLQIGAHQRTAADTRGNAVINRKPTNIGLFPGLNWWAVQDLNL
jgi:hypothetical protein